MTGEYQGKRPGEVNLRSGNIQASWERFKQKFGFFLIAIGQDKATPQVKFAHLMGEAGEDAIEVYNSFAHKLITHTKDAEGKDVVDTDNSQDYESVVKLFDQYAAEKKCVTACRERFNSRNQKGTESFSQWITDLRNLVKQCEYGAIEDSMLKDRIVWGVHDRRLKETLRSKSNLSLDEIVDVCKAYEATNRQSGNEMALDLMSIQTRADKVNGHQTQRGRGRGGSSRGRGQPRATPYSTRGSHHAPAKKEAPPTYKCRKCTSVHAARQCPAWNHECKKCGGKHHYEIVCDGKPRPKKTNLRQPHSVHLAEEITNSEEEALLTEPIQPKTPQVRYVHMLKITSEGIITSGESSHPRKEYTEVVRLQGEHYVRFKLDGGSEVNIIPFTVFQLINRNYTVKPTNVRLSSYGKFITSPYGQVDLLVETNHGDKKVYTFQISKIDDRPILGNVACEELNLVRRVKHPEQQINLVSEMSIVLPPTKELFLEQYSKLFTGLGEFTTKVHIQIDPTVQPEMCPPRRYHFSLLDKMKAKIVSLVDRGIVAPINAHEVPTFVSNLVVREKGDGDLRICLDPEKLNKAIVEYLPGKYLYLADLLSRQCLVDPVEDDPEMMEMVHEVTMYTVMEPEQRIEYIRETNNDTGLACVKKYYRQGWPLNKKLVEPAAAQYWQVRHDLFVEDDLVILGDRIVVPLQLRRKALETLHKAHMGIEKAKAKARQTMYWPAMSNDIATMMQGCRICERNAPANIHEPIIPQEIPRYPFQKISVDIMELTSHNYLVIVDNLSKWLEIKKLNSKSSASVIGALRQVFAIHGIPEIIYGDNNPLNSKECHEYAQAIGSTIVTSSPEYPRSNGLAEKGVHIAKQLLKKSAEAKTHYLDALLEYNNTPLSGTNVSPSQVLMSRTCRTLVPVLTRNLEPKVVDVRDQLKQKQAKVKNYHDKHAKVKTVAYQPGDKVTVYRNNKWVKGTVIRKHSAPRSYMVRIMGGSLLRRNTYHLRPSKTIPDSYDKIIPVDIEGLIAQQREKVDTTPPETHSENPVSTETSDAEMGAEIPATGKGDLLGGDSDVETEAPFSPTTRSRSGRRIKRPRLYGYED
ncbi:hypothetical protein KUF71_001028 [Frankliniella fusca]|uniref:RNA-directed DNA polymerase n=1 Tax=Frankliniella fusca TaxID=407009 RepID=A0AAE1LHI1_9NEOP|nr:hypothetical protein KUF71_001028 [Frankliniella fusca]